VLNVVDYEIAEFEGFILDLAHRGLRTGDREIELRPRSFDVLCYLVVNSDRLVTKDELIKAIWPDVVVTDESVTRCISDVRLALCDTEQRIIKTLPRRGYCFAVPVHRRSRDNRHASQPIDQSALRLTPTEFGSPSHELQSIDAPSIAVLPFANLSGEASQEYLSDGITEDIINGLSYFSTLSVIARNSSFSYKGRAIDVREIGQQLAVRYVVEGSVRRIGDRIRITAQLVDTQTRIRRWGERFDRALGDVFAVQDEITQSIVRIVVAHLGNAELERVSRKPPSSWNAYDLMMQGDQRQRELEQTWNPNLLYETRRLYAEAFKADPSSARICAKLSHTYIRAYTDPAGQECGNPSPLQHGYELASKAVRLDPSLPEARTQLGWAYFWMKQSESAVREFETAVALNPNFFEFPYAAVFAYIGAPSRTLDILREHLRLDPFHPPQLHAIHGHALYMLKQYTEAVKPLRECIQRGPNVILGQLWLTATLVRLGKVAEASTIAADILRKVPRLKIDAWPALSVYTDPRDAEHVAEPLRRVGLK
jgi:adenylate cyclase